MEEERGPEWITKKEAIRLTGWKERTLERYLQLGHIARDRHTAPGTRPETIVLLADVQKILAAQEQKSVEAKDPILIKTVERKPTQDVARRVSANGSLTNGSPYLPAASPPQVITVPLPMPQPRQEKKERWLLTIEEAAEISGFTPTHLKRAIRLHRLIAIEDGGYRMTKEHLGKYLQLVMKEAEKAASEALAAEQRNGDGLAE